MRPIRRDASPQTGDFDPYQNARDPLRGRIGPFCSFCERRTDSSLAVEHIQAKSLPAYAGLIGTWTNFLLACSNCNSAKGTKDFLLADVLLPDRDNTFHAFDYTEDGSISVRSGLTGQQTMAAQRTLQLVGLDKAGYEFLDDNGKQVVVDRISKRKEIWLAALEARSDLNETGPTPRRLTAISNLAVAYGGFSIWMKVFKEYPEVLARLINDHPGTATSGCFNNPDGAVVTPHPNADGLAHGSKT